MFDKDDECAIRQLVDRELRLIHQLNAARGSHRYMCQVDNGHPIFSHTPVGTVLRDFNDFPTV
jgi:hypothetical protein